MNDERTVLVVEDDPDQLANYSQALIRKGFDCVRCASVQAVGEQLIKRPVLALLDVHLDHEPDAGFALAQRLILQYPGLPVIFLSSRTDEIDQIFGLRLGAWDYLTKPISTVLLAEKVAAVVRQVQRQSASDSDSADLMSSAGWQLDGKRMQISFAGQVANLTVTELSIVQCLMSADGGVVGFDELAAQTRQSIVTNNTLSTHIKHIRRKLMAIDPGFNALHSLYGRGYQWLAVD